MSDGTVLKTVYLCDGSFAGILSAVHRAYYSREIPDEILCVDGVQREFMTRYVEVETDCAKARAVYASIPKKISNNALQTAYQVYLSEEEDKATAIYRFLRLGYRIGRKVEQAYSDPDALRALKISWYVGGEAHRLCGFLRFQQMEGGVYYAPVSPVNNILELLCRYFADRMPSDPWVICDTRRSIAAAYDTRQWVLRKVDTVRLPDVAQGEKEFAALWREFYKTIGIEGRKNENLRRQLMPKMYWKNMTEFQLPK